MTIQNLKTFLDQKVEEYNTHNFIDLDPISIPHQYTKLQDIEITAFFAAMLAWGQRKTIINKCNELFSFMDNAPHDFILNHQDCDLRKVMSFKHRTFNSTDLLYFISFFKYHYGNNNSLESAFTKTLSIHDESIENSLKDFHDYFFSLEDFPQRTKKHIPTPMRKSACKRINMFMRWMVRKDNNGVDFGLWRGISSKQLICPCDVHVDRVARKLGLISRKQTDWQTALELTNNLRKMDVTDPVKYDFALFGLGVIENF